MAKASKLDPSITNHVTGGGIPVVGTKALIFASRNSNVNERLITVKCKDGTKRVINDVDLETGEVLGPTIKTKLGAPHVVTTIADGTEVLVGARFMLRLNENQADRDIKYKRCRYLRPITVLDDNYKEQYGQRNDTESGNARLKAALPNGRAHVKGPEHLMVALLGYQLLKNSVAVETYRRRLTSEAFSPPLAA